MMRAGVPGAGCSWSAAVAPDGASSIAPTLRQAPSTLPLAAAAPPGCCLPGKPLLDSAANSAPWLACMRPSGRLPSLPPSSLRGLHSWSKSMAG